MICRLLLTTFFALCVMPMGVSAQNPSGPEIGVAVDDFSLQDQHGTSRKLSEMLEQSPVAIVAFRSADW